MLPLGGSACWNAEEKCSWQERTSWFVALNVFQVQNCMCEPTVMFRSDQ